MAHTLNKSPDPLGVLFALACFAIILVFVFCTSCSRYEPVQCDFRAYKLIKIEPRRRVDVLTGHYGEVWVYIWQEIGRNIFKETTGGNDHLFEIGNITFAMTNK